MFSVGGDEYDAVEEDEDIDDLNQDDEGDNIELVMPGKKIETSSDIQ